MNPTQGPLRELHDANSRTVTNSDHARDLAGRALTRQLGYTADLPHAADSAAWNVIAYERRSRELTLNEM